MRTTLLALVSSLLNNTSNKERARAYIDKFMKESENSTDEVCTFFRGLFKDYIEDNRVVMDGTTTLDKVGGCFSFKPEEPIKDSLQKLQFDIQEWSDKTFGKRQANPAILYHLSKEVDELIQCFIKENDEDTINEELTELYHDIVKEYADVFMLILDSAAHFHLTTDALIKATRDKLEVNKQRKWGKPDENGVIEHIKETGGK